MTPGGGVCQTKGLEARSQRPLSLYGHPLARTSTHGVGVAFAPNSAREFGIRDSQVEEIPQTGERLLDHKPFLVGRGQQMMIKSNQRGPLTKCVPYLKTARKLNRVSGA